MVNEAVLIIQQSIPIPLTVDNAVGIEKGAILKLIDPATASGANITANNIVAGIAASEKIANDGTTKLGFYRGQGNIFKVTASGAITVGDGVGLAVSAVTATGENYVKSLNTGVGFDASGSRILGFSLETAATGETFLMEMNISDGSK